MSILKKITDRYFYWKSWQTKQARQFSETLSNICNANLFQADWNSRKISENLKFSSFSISYIKWKHVHLDFLKPFEYYPPSKYMFKIVLNPLSVNPRNPKFSSFSISYIKWKHVHLDFLKPFEYYPPSKYMFKIVLNPLSVNPRNGQTHSNNSSATADEFFSVCDHFVGLAIKGLKILDQCTAYCAYFVYS